MTVQSFTARSIGSHVADVFSRPRTGHIIAVFAHSCYVELDAWIIALVSPDLLNGPLNVVLSQLPEIALARLSTSEPVRLTDGDLEIADTFRVDLRAAAVWDARLPFLSRVERKLLWSQLDAVKSVLNAAPKESLAQAGSRPPRASEGMDALYSGLRHRDDKTLKVGIDRLVGLGAGLTPSGDDVLAGMMIALHLLRPNDANTVGSLVLQTVRGRTTKISLAYLQAAADGNAGEAWHNLARQFEHRNDELPTAARRVMAFGETSGADMLTGFVLTAEALLAG